MTIIWHTYGLDIGNLFKSFLASLLTLFLKNISITYVFLKDDQNFDSSTVKKCCSNSQVGIGWVQNEVLYLRYGSSSKINTPKWYKSLLDENP